MALDLLMYVYGRAHRLVRADQTSLPAGVQPHHDMPKAGPICLFTPFKQTLHREILRGLLHTGHLGRIYLSRSREVILMQRMYRDVER